MAATVEKFYTWVNWINGNATQEMIDYFFKSGIINMAKALLRRRLVNEKTDTAVVQQVLRSAAPGACAPWRGRGREVAGVDVVSVCGAACVLHMWGPPCVRVLAGRHLSTPPCGGCGGPTACVCACTAVPSVRPEAELRPHWERPA
jgi:hypothetical protein